MTIQTKLDIALSRPAPQTKEVDKRRFACDGGKAGLGHPRVFLSIGAEGFVDCPYCDCRYTLSATAHEAH